MKDFRPIWKELTSSKSNSFRDHIQRCILIGQYRGNTFEEKVDIAHRLLDKAVTIPDNQSRNKLSNAIHWASKPYYGMAAQVLENDAEKEEFEKIGLALREANRLEKLGAHYSYIFVLDQLVPEQILVQGLHASMLMGQKLTEAKAWPNGVTASNLNFIITRGQSSGEVVQRLIRDRVKHACFHDWDYTFNDNGELERSGLKTLKTVITYPVPFHKKHKYDDLELLRLAA